MKHVTLKKSVKSSYGDSFKGVSEMSTLGLKSKLKINRNFAFDFEDCKKYKKVSLFLFGI